MNSGADWPTHNQKGKLVMLASSQRLPCMEEELTGADTRNCGRNFTGADIDYFIRQLEQAIALAEPDKVNIYYVGWSLGMALDQTLLEEWLRRIVPYVQSGQVQWKTLPEMYDAYVQWEQSHGRIATTLPPNPRSATRLPETATGGGWVAKGRTPAVPNFDNRMSIQVR